MKRLIAIGSLAALLSACGSSPTSPTVTPPVVTPAAATFNLSGTVTSTAGGGISGATVRIVDGANAGKSTTTAAGGAYGFTGLAVAGQTVSASATFYSSASKGVSTTSNQTVDFQLTPTPIFTATGTGDTVFDMPLSVARVRVTGVPTTSCQNFIVRIGGRASIINVILGTCSVADARTLDSTYLTGGGGVVSIVSSTGVQWTFTEVR